MPLPWIAIWIYADVKRRLTYDTSGGVFGDTAWWEWCLIFALFYLAPVLLITGVILVSVGVGRRRRARRAAVAAAPHTDP